MKISVLLVVAILFLLLLLLFVIAERGILSHSKKDWLYIHSSQRAVLSVYCVLLALFAFFCCMLTVKHYIYPSDERVFKNADYHAVTMHGFESDSARFLLMNSDYINSQHYQPELGLWDGQNGYVSIDSTQMVIEHVFAPMYIQTDNEDYRLANANTARPALGDKGCCTFVISNDKGTLLTIRCEERKKKLLGIPIGAKISYYLFRVGKDSVWYESSFTRRINWGYRLQEIIAKTPGLNLPEEVETAISDAYLLRESVPSAENKFVLVTSKRNESALLLQVGETCYDGGYLINNDTIVDKPVTIPLNLDKDKPTRFFSGIGNARSDMMSIKKEGEKLYLLYALAKMFPLRRDAGRVLVTSNPATFDSDSDCGGYFYNLFYRNDNIHHCNASMRYKVADSQHNIQFVINDLNIKEKSEPIRVSSDQKFILSTQDEAIHWVLSVQNMRDNGGMSMTWKNIFLYVFLFVLIVWTRMVLDNVFEQHSVSVVEMAAYVVILSLWVVRMIIGWRVEAFAPLQHINVGVFSEMRHTGVASSYRLLSFYVLPIVMCLFPIVRRITEMNLADRFTNQFACRKWISLLFLLALVIMAVLSHSSDKMGRLCNIAFPCLLFFLFEFWITHIEQVREFRLGRVRWNLAILLLIYLAFADAGFAVIFLVYLAIHYGIVRVLFSQEMWQNHSIRVQMTAPYVLSTIVMVGIILFMNFEGWLMLKVIDNLSVILLVIGLVMVGLALLRMLLWRFRDDEYHMEMEVAESRWLHVWYGFVMAFGLCFAIDGGMAMMGKESMLVPMVQNKVIHMKYRAEIQNLPEDKRVDEMIRKCDFDSDGIMFTMRSAHNQWFINQYLRMGKAREAYFQLQPHSNQGSTYTTQTTDLILLRYVIAEHGQAPVRRALILIMLLLLICSVEMSLGNKLNMISISGIILLYTIALMIYLSATNRIVFIGQDFPFIGTQSLMAVLFPILLMWLSMVRLQWMRGMDEFDANDVEDVNGHRVMLFAIFFVMMFFCLWCIPVKGEKQQAQQFDLSEIVLGLSQDIEPINALLEQFQEEHRESIRNKPVVEVWEAFRQDDYSRELVNTYLERISDDFNRSAFLNFDTLQVEKKSPDALIHLRRRNHTCRIDVNRKYYFIPQIEHDTMAWDGSVLAAHVEPNIRFNSRGVVSVLNKQQGYQKNIFPRQLSSKDNVEVSQFDGKWIGSTMPLIIASIQKAQSDRSTLRVEKDSVAIEGQAIPAVAINANDMLFVTKRQKGKKKTLLSGVLSSYKDQYLAKNIWINGEQKLFYPLGKKFFWAYNFANLTATEYRKDPVLRHQDVRVSIDYAMTEAMYNWMDGVHNGGGEAKYANKLLTEFQELDFRSQCDRHNAIMYYDISLHKIILKSKKSSILKEVKSINLQINKYLCQSGYDDEEALDYSISDITKHKYDFCAVAIEGTGKIRMLFDYKAGKHLDPNNVQYLNRVVAELYQNGDSRTERELLGNKSLQIMRSGPGSTFKPIAYTAITSQRDLNWRSLSLEPSAGIVSAAEYNGKTKVFHQYAGVKGKFNIDGDVNGLMHNTYLIRSNNAYHSLVVMLGLQSAAYMEEIMRPYASAIVPDSFPVFQYNGQNYVFKSTWYPSMNFEASAINTGVANLFRLTQDTRYGVLDRELLGSGRFMHPLAQSKSSMCYWTYPEFSSFNKTQRNQSDPKQGFLQLLMGAAPIDATPLKMAEMAQRMATFNSAADITTLDDDTEEMPYSLWRIDGWNSTQKYFDFYRDVVYRQLRSVPRNGTAHNYKKYIGDARANALERKGLYIYCKTGTLSDGTSATKRVKNMLIFITNKALENVSDVDELKDVKNYAIYLSFQGAQEGDVRFGEALDKITSSDVFNEYFFAN